MLHISQSDQFDETCSYFRGETKRNLGLLRAITQTIDTLTMLCSIFHAQAKLVSKLTLALHSDACDSMLDESKAVTALEATQDYLVMIYADLKAKKRCAQEDADLKSDDGVVEAFELAMSSVDCYNENVEALRWEILEHNANVMNKDHLTANVITNAAGVDAFFSGL